MLLGYHTNSLQNHRLAEALELLSAHGYQAVAITPDTCHLDPATTTERDLDATARQLRDLGLRPIMESGARFVLDPRQKHEPTLMTRDPKARHRRLEFYSRLAAMGARLGATVLSLWSGIDRAPGEDSSDWMLQGIAEAARRVRREGLEPALEPEPGMAVETVADWHAVRAALGDEAPAMTLDIGHLYAVPEGEPVDVIRACAGFVAQVHLEDMRHGIHEHLLPGAGDVDFESILRQLDISGYEHAVCFELSRSSHCAVDAVALGRQVWRRCLGGAEP
ncbi:MAG: sugar phosphate isomerase/epimerase [Planctomycetes bacterium]|nr:sugar phosphate isomerase/epimerase [Planctomycetota bacterium]